MNGQRLCDRYDVGLFDLDGVVYAGDQPVAHAADSIAAARAAGMRAGFVTNNASRTPSDVQAKLAGSGVDADIADIITSAQVAARALRERLAPGSEVLVVGDTGLREAVTEAGLRVVETAADSPVAVVQGHSPRTGWTQLAEATIAVRAGALWVATNADSTIPTDRGILAGNGAFVKVVADVLDRRPDVIAGKPDRTMHRASVERMAAQRPLVIGDRLDTDIEGATASDCDSLYVMTGVSTPSEVLNAAPQHRPTYVASDLRGLLRAAPAIREALGGAGRWSVTENGIACGGGDPGEDDAADYLAAACAAAWADRAHGPVDAAAESTARELGL